MKTDDTPSPVHQPCAAPPGWKLVPIEPTPAMLDKGGMEHAMNFQRMQTADMAAHNVYRAMLAAAPSADGVAGDSKPEGNT